MHLNILSNFVWGVACPEHDLYKVNILANLDCWLNDKIREYYLMIRDYLLLPVACGQFGRETAVSIWDAGSGAAWRLTSGLPVRLYRRLANWQSRREKTNRLEQSTASGRLREKKESLKSKSKKYCPLIFCERKTLYHLINQTDNSRP